MLRNKKQRFRIRGFNLQGKTKEEEAIEFIREHEPPEGYFLGFSGGKDSVVLYDLTIKSGVKFEAYYSATGIGAPELIKFIKQHYSDVVWLRLKCSFFKKMQTWGYPTIFARWCCDWLKKTSAKAIPLNHRLMGLRAEESAKRKARGIISKHGKQTLYKPIFNWLEWEIWEYIDSNNLPYCSLYDEGFRRLGCVVCPFICSANRKHIDHHKNRWPKQYHAFEMAMKKLWDDKEHIRQIEKGYSASFEEFLNNWYQGISTIKDQEPYFWNENPNQQG